MPRSAVEFVDELLSVDFLERTFRQRHQIFRKILHHTDEILSWADVNAILRHCRIEYPRLRLVRDGNPLSPDRYTFSRPVRSGRTVSLIDPPAVNAAIRQGATLIVDAVDELRDPIALVASRIERIAREQVGASMYASSGTDPGMDVHWDDLDVLAVQLSGKKLWQILGPARVSPLFRDSQPNDSPPRTVLAEAVLDAGDALYLPRGWWHSVRPLGSPSLHVTFGISSRTGADLIFWLRDQLLDNVLTRTDIPRFGPKETQRTYLKNLFEAFASEWSDDLIERYFNDQDSRAPVRPSFSLPWSLAETSTLASIPTFARLMAPRVRLMPAGETLILLANGRKIELDLVVGPILYMLLDGREHAIDELAGQANAGIEGAELIEMLAILAESGIVALS